jgi:hypothetical protein
VAFVFVSHRGVDSDAAERIAEEIQAAGHHVWLDIWEIGLGDSIIERMNEGIAASAFLVLCCSVAGVDAPWISREWLSALARQLRGESVRLLPVLLPGGRAPAIIADLKHADLGADWHAGLAELLRAIGP